MTESNLSFWQELKRRDVFRAATVYLVTAWLIIEISATIFPYLGIPDWIITYLIYALIIGFPIAVILAWIYEISPKGMIKTSSVESKSNPLPAHKRKPLTSNWIIGILLIIVIVETLYFSDLFEQTTEIKSVSIAVIDVDNQTKEEELDGISGLLITSLQNSKHLNPLTRSRLMDIAKQIGKENITPIDESLGLEISKKAKVPLMLLASIQNFGTSYSIDLKVLDVDKKVYVFTHTERADSKEGIYDMIDAATFKLRDHMEDEPIVFVQQKKVAEQTTKNMQAYYHYFKGQEFLNQWKKDESEFEFKKALKIDSSFNMALYGLFLNYNWWGEREKRDRTLKQLVAIRDKLPAKEKAIVTAFAQWRLYGNNNEDLAILRQLKNDYPMDKDILFFFADRHLRVFEGIIQIQKRGTENFLDTAQLYFERIIKLDPEMTFAVDLLCRVYSYQNNFVKAYSFTKKNLNKIYKDTYTISLFLNAAAKANKLAEAKEQLSDQLKVHLLDISDFKLALSMLNLINDSYNVDTLYQTYKETAKHVDFKYLGNILGKYTDLIKAVDDSISTNWQRKDSIRTAQQVAVKARLLINLDRQNWQVPNDLNELMNNLIFENHFYARYFLYKRNYEKLDQLLIELKRKKEAAYYLYEGIKSLNNNDDNNLKLMKDSASFQIDIYHWLTFFNTRQAIKKKKYQSVKNDINDLLSTPLFSVSQAYFFAYPYMLYYKARILESEGKRDEAIKAYEKFLNLWKYADKDIPELIEAKKRYAKLKQVN